MDLVYSGLKSDRRHFAACHWQTLEYLCSSTRRGKEWGSESWLMRPSSGMISVVFAMQAKGTQG